MFSTTAYLYQQKQQVVMIDTNGIGGVFQRRWEPMYTKNLKATKGVDNVILFEFINQDQKPVDITGSGMTFRIISQDGTTQLYQEDLVVLNATYGRAKVTIPSTALDLIDPQKAGYSIAYTQNTSDLTQPVFSDAYSNTRGQIDIIDGVHPHFIPSHDMNLPTQSAQPPGGPNRNHTGAVDAQDRALMTFQLDFDNFTGNIKPQASDTNLGPWKDCGDLKVYTNQSSRDYINVPGYHKFVRFEVEQSGNGAVATAVVNADGTIDHISAHGGVYYPAIPRVTITGTGSGASATATATADGKISGVTLVDPGYGYNKDNTKVKIDSGAITKITYR